MKKPRKHMNEFLNVKDIVGSLMRLAQQTQSYKHFKRGMRKRPRRRRQAGRSLEWVRFMNGPVFSAGFPPLDYVQPFHGGPR